MKKLFTITIAAFLGLYLNAQVKYDLTTTNLTNNPKIEDLNSDNKLGGDLFSGDYFYGFGQDTEIGFWDQATTHTADGTGSWRMEPEVGGKVTYGGRCLLAPVFPVKVGDELTLSFYAKASNFPAPTYVFKFQTYKTGYKTYWRYGAVQAGLLGTIRGTFSEKDEWQEFVAKCTIVDTTIKYVCPYMLFESSRNKFLDGDSTFSNYGQVWIDDVHISKQRIAFRENPSEKNSFDGAAVKVDNLGNITMKDANNNFNDFFPMAVCGATGRNTSAYQSVYKAQGLNMEARAWSVSRAKEVVNGGMLYGYDVTKYIDPKKNEDLGQIATDINGLSSNGILDKCVFYYIDNELQNNYKRVKDVVDAIRAVDADRPIYMNNGMVPLEARRFASSETSDPLVNMCGAYVGSGDGAFADGAKRLIIGNNIEKQRIPFNIAHIQEGVDTAFRATLYAGIANGAKGFIFWKDKFDDGYSIEDYPWWKDLPTIKTEIDKMMSKGIIQAPESNWNISFPTDSTTILEWGARDADGKKYLILSNLKQTSSYDEYGEIVLTPEDVTTTITVNNLGFDIKEVRDFFTGDAVTTTISGNSFDVTIPANTAVVYELSDRLTGIKEIESNISIYPNPTRGNITVAPGNNITLDVTITNIIGAVIKQQQIQGRTTIDIANQPNGIYFVKAGNKTSKIILSK